jgi:hypothetical protein
LEKAALKTTSAEFVEGGLRGWLAVLGGQVDNIYLVARRLHSRQLSGFNSNVRKHSGKLGCFPAGVALMVCGSHSGVCFVFFSVSYSIQISRSVSGLLHGMCVLYPNRFQFHVLWQRDFISNESASTVSWIGSIQLALQFMVGAASGRLFDKGYFHVVMISGTVLLLFSYVFSSPC